MTFVLPYRSFSKLDEDFDAIAAALNAGGGGLAPVATFIAGNPIVQPVAPESFAVETAGGAGGVSNLADPGGSASDGRQVTVMLIAGNASKLRTSARDFEENSSTAFDFASVQLVCISGVWSCINSNGVLVI